MCRRLPHWTVSKYKAFGYILTLIRRLILRNGDQFEEAVCFDDVIDQRRDASWRRALELAAHSTDDATHFIRADSRGGSLPSVRLQLVVSCAHGDDALHAL